MNETVRIGSVSSLMVGIAACWLMACGSDATSPPAASGGTSPSGGSAGASAGTTSIGGSTPAAGGMDSTTDLGGTGDVAGSAGTSGGSAGTANIAGSAGTAGSGTGGGGGGGGGAGGGDSKCNGAAVCESFEGLTLAPNSDWSVDSSTASSVVEVVSNKGHTGTSSVHISFTTGNVQSFVSVKKGFPAVGNAYWGRAWIFENVPFGGHQIYVEARVGSGSDKTGVRSFNTFGKDGALGLNLESNDNSANSKIVAAKGTWVCYEWQITGIGSTGTLTSYVDSTPTGPVPTPVQVGTLMNKPIPNLMRQRIGFQRYEAGAAGEMWIDDVAISDKRINCTP